jgi:hypothetical protein
LRVTRKANGNDRDANSAHLSFPTPQSNNQVSDLFSSTKSYSVKSQAKVHLHCFDEELTAFNFRLLHLIKQQVFPDAQTCPSCLGKIPHHMENLLIQDEARETTHFQAM